MNPEPAQDAAEAGTAAAGDEAQRRYLALEAEAALLPHAAQLTRGFRLRFEPALESEFRDAFWARNTERVYYGVLIGVLIIIAFALKDILTYPREVWIWTAGIRLFVVIPAILLLYLLTRHRSRALGELCVAGGGLIALFGLASAICASILLGHNMPYEGLLIITFYLYFMIGLRLPLAMLAALPLLPAFVAGCVLLDLPPADTVIRSFYLLTANVIGIFGVYTLERLAREGYLTEQLARFRAERDPLTLIYNRRALLEHLRRLWRLGRRQGEALAVFLIDVDHFKPYNDRHGHLAGDRCLIGVARALTACLNRPLDMVGRFGGEEFLAIAYNPSPESLEQLADRLCRMVASTTAGPDYAAGVTVSIGAACLVPEKHLDESRLLEYADTALYRAKDRGRNRYEVIRLEPVGSPAAPGHPAPAAQ
ncbi:MAG: diguanylate cyclase [Gammaproteobacteria bacterium]